MGFGTSYGFRHPVGVMVHMPYRYVVTTICKYIQSYGTTSPTDYHSQANWRCPLCGSYKNWGTRKVNSSFLKDTDELEQGRGSTQS